MTRVRKGADGAARTTAEEKASLLKAGGE